MPLVAQEHGVPSTLATVIGQVKDAFSAMADATPIMVGKQYLEHFGVGQPPRVLFVPETDGRTGPAIEMGHAASVTHGCQVFVRGAEGGDDLTRFENAEALEAKVIACLAVAASGRIIWGVRADASPVDVQLAGAELSFGFLFRRDIPHDAARWSLAAAPADTSDPRPRPPPGQPGIVDEVAVTVEPIEPEEED